MGHGVSVSFRVLGTILGMMVAQREWRDGVLLFAMFVVVQMLLEVMASVVYIAYLAEMLGWLVVAIGAFHLQYVLLEKTPADD